MANRTLLRIGVSVLAYSVLAFIAYQPVKCVNSYKKYKASIVQPSEMKAVNVDEKSDIPYEQVYWKVKDVAKKDYKSVVKELKTPLEAIIYCTKVLSYKDDKIVYGKLDYWASFKNIHKNKMDDCDGGALAAAAILSDDGFPPYIMVIENLFSAHGVFVYKTTEGEYNSIGINAADCITSRKSIEELKEALSMAARMENTKMQIYDLSKRFPDYIDNDRNNDLRSTF